MRRIVESMSRTGYRTGSRGCCMCRIVCRTSRKPFRSYRIGYRMSRIVERMSRTGYRTGSRGCCMSRIVYRI
jgi:hypothetical protein